MSEAAIGIGALLLNLHPVGQERHGELAPRRTSGNEGGDIAFDVCIADGLTNVRVTTAGHPLTVELHFQLVMTESKNAKIVSTIAIEAVHLGRNNHAASSWRSF